MLSITNYYGVVDDTQKANMYKNNNVCIHKNSIQILLVRFKAQTVFYLTRFSIKKKYNITHIHDSLQNKMIIKKSK